MRIMEDRLRRLAAAFPVLILTGARQTGKTALLKRLFPDHHYVSLDLQLLAEQAEEAPASFLQDHPAPLVIDEVQYAPGLFRHLKVAVDGARSRRGQFILTGSGAFAALDAVAAVLRNASGIIHVEVGLVGRMAATRRLGASRTAVSGFRVADFLPADD